MLREGVLCIAVFEDKAEVVVFALAASEVEVLAELPTDHARVLVETITAYADCVFVLVQIEARFACHGTGWAGSKTCGTKKDAVQFHGAQRDRAP